MRTIGIYDSGVGGLTVLKEILENFAGNAIFYYADNAHAPFGQLDDVVLADIIADGLGVVQARSDLTVVACNTASTLLNSLAHGTKYECKSQNDVFIMSKCDDKPHIKPILGILPPVPTFAENGISNALPTDVLLLATEGTKRHLRLPSGMHVASTPELATMIETVLTKGDDMSSLLPYLSETLSPFKGVKNVILGCTHYPLCKRQLAEVLRDANFCDGTRALISALKNFVSDDKSRPAPVNFAFSGTDESQKYSRILQNLTKDADR